MRALFDSIRRLSEVGISLEDAAALRRISMTLHRWHELECGDSYGQASWCITRGRKETRHSQHAGGHGAHHVFIHDEDGKPFMETHLNDRPQPIYTSIPDRERGAQRRLAAILKRYPGFQAYVQGDPRGCALYILPPGAIPEGADVASCYNRGVAVYK